MLDGPGSPQEAMGQASSDHGPVVKATGLTKQFGNVQALLDVDLEIYPREIVALAGDNGAGKSTLVSILSGLTRPDTGEIEVDGRREY